MEKTPVDTLYSEIDALRRYLIDEEEISLLSSADENFKKTLLLAAASFFDSVLRDSLLKFFRDISTAPTLNSEFAQSVAINSRKYHTLFNWDNGSVASFYKLFGEGFKTHMLQKEKAEPSFADAAKAFLEVGAERNRLVHQNFAAFTMEKNAAEIYSLYQTAVKFVEETMFELYRVADQKASIASNFHEDAASET